MKVMSFQQYWEAEYKRIAMDYAESPEVLVVLHAFAKRTWQQATYTSNNAER